MRIPKFKNKALWLAVVVLIVLATNPEVRAFLMLAEAIGVETFIFAIWVYLRGFSPQVFAVARRLVRPLIRHLVQAVSPLIHAAGVVVSTFLPRQAALLTSFYFLLKAQLSMIARQEQAGAAGSSTG